MNREELTKNAIVYLKLKVRGSLEKAHGDVAVHCPFHKDNTPSMYIHLGNGIFHCFSCRRQGSIESLFRELTGTSLYKTLGISVNEFTGFSFKPQVLPEENLDNLNKSIVLIIEGELTPIESSPKALGYLRKRGISIKVANDMNFKYAEKSYINKTLFEKRLVIPIYEKGSLIAVEGRDISGQSDKKVIYPKGSSVNTLYDLDNLDTTQPLYATEGLMDLALLREYPEFKNSTAIFGAAVTRRQLHLLEKFDTVIYIPDNDKAGDSTLQTFKQHKMRNIKVLRLPKIVNGIAIKDVGDLVIKAGFSVKELIKKKWLLKAVPIL